LRTWLAGRRHGVTGAQVLMVIAGPGNGGAAAQADNISGQLSVSPATHLGVFIFEPFKIEAARGQIVAKLFLLRAEFGQRFALLRDGGSDQIKLLAALNDDVVEEGDLLALTA